MSFLNLLTTQNKFYGYLICRKAFRSVCHPSIGNSQAIYDQCGYSGQCSRGYSLTISIENNAWSSKTKHLTKTWTTADYLLYKLSHKSCRFILMITHYLKKLHRWTIASGTRKSGNCLYLVWDVCQFEYCSAWGQGVPHYRAIQHSILSVNTCHL